MFGLVVGMYVDHAGEETHCQRLPGLVSSTPQTPPPTLPEAGKCVYKGLKKMRPPGGGGGSKVGVRST